LATWRSSSSIAAQAWLGRLCPLTCGNKTCGAWPARAAYTESFVGHWLARLLYWDAPWWVFVATYTAFAVLVALAWWWVRPGHARNAP